MSIFDKISIVTICIMLTMSCGKSSNKDTVFSNTVKAYNKTKNSLAIDQISTLEEAINSYLIDHDEYPSSLDQLVPEYLRTESQIKDPWGSPFEIRIDDDDKYYIISPGRDLVFDTDDDIKRSL